MTRYDRKRRFGKMICLCFVLGIAPTLRGQNCAVHPDQKLFAMDAAWGDHFGTSVAVKDDVAIVGMPQGDQDGNATGAAWVLRRKGDTWGFEQKLLAPNGSALDKFGSSVSIDGDVVVIGAPHSQTSLGSAYVFRYQSGSWNLDGKLTVGGSINFGASVAVSGNVIVIGDPLRNLPGANNAGAAHVYKYSGSAWIYQAMLVASDAGTYDQFGTSVAASENWIIVGAPFDIYGGGLAGAAYAFHFDVASWTQTQKLTPADLAGGDYFGRAVAIDGDAIVLGAPGDDQPGAQSVGAAYIFRWLTGAWSQEAKLLAYDGAQGDLMGTAVAIQGGTAVVGAHDNSDTSLFSGCAYSFRFDGSAWNGNCKLVSGDYGDAAYADQFGTGVAVTGDTAIIGTPFDHVLWPETGSVCVLPAYPDCNNNGIIDPCELPDCNGNRAPDVCDLEAKTSQDCNGDEVPDECGPAVSYQLDDDTPDGEWGYDFFPGDIVWLNQFTVTLGHQIVNFVDIGWASHATEGMPVTVMIYDDPNNDQDPSDAVLLASVETRTYDYASENSWAMGWARVQVPSTYVGNPGDSFFIGARVGTLPQTYPVLADFTGPSLGRSWMYGSDFGQSDIVHLPNNGNPSTNYGNFMLRAGTSDCNANGIFDGCDLLNGTSVDKNANGVPDECDACRADFVPQGGDGVVGVPDLLAVIAAWGMPGQGNPADINADGNINAADLLIILNGWGLCP